ncbi:hypothetical protein N826_41260 [Skermanella aerolata KACC 11604]|nr:hypothetical protein N826_41260 [Skermanella aerolata KACC 11604]
MLLQIRFYGYRNAQFSQLTIKDVDFYFFSIRITLRHQN